VSVQILTPSVPKHLLITQTMWEDFMFDPVMAAYVIFGVELDDFQGARLRYYWWVQNVIDSSGVSSGKTIVIWLFLMLRCILLPDHVAAIYYPTFGTGKQEFWQYFARFARMEGAKIFRSQIGDSLKVEPGEEVDGDGTVHGADCYRAVFRNGNMLMMPATNAARNMLNSASLRLNTLVGEEWTILEDISDGIDAQLIDRTSRQSFNQHHPIWGNHILLSAHAETRMHPAYARYREHEKRCRAGDPTYANISYSYKDFSSRPCHTGKTFKDEYRTESTIKNRNTSTKDVGSLLGRAFGIWSAHTKGWFTEEHITQCCANGRLRNVQPASSRADYLQMHGLKEEDVVRE